MIKSVNGYELNKIEKTKKNNTYQTKTNKKLTKTQAQRLEEDEELASRSSLFQPGEHDTSVVSTEGRD